MATEPHRREQRRTHLDASVVPVERALIARAGKLGDNRETAHKVARIHGIEDYRLIEALADTVADLMAGQLLDLAEELHWW